MVNYSPASAPLLDATFAALSDPPPCISPASHGQATVNSLAVLRHVLPAVSKSARLDRRFLRRESMADPPLRLNAQP